MAAGLAKLCVPATPAEYVAPATMRALLSADGVTPRFNPAAPSLARRIIASDAMLRAVAVGTLALELVVMPATFVLPARARWAVVGLCLLFHAGIGAAFTVVAGTMFFQLGGAYVFGLGSDLAPGSAPWAAGLAFALLPAASLAFRGHPYAMGECWPATNGALFPWSAKQLAFLESLRGGRRRLVLTTYPAAAAELVGRPVTQRGQRAAPDANALAVHDAPGNLWNWTKVYPDFVKALNAVLAGDTPHDLAAVALVPRVQAWLHRDAPLVQTVNDRPLLFAFLVDLDEDKGAIAKVIKQCQFP